ncbi:hypothetical protein CspeluHIS016_0200860 [Cutaneotrichosporon spelunceum]|uniref:GST N-terminal domain-containing protein n=1 Tax=Cutaneotrichosporon spelunceum TaxID=1672016 RepID=A0AAD3TRF4_9TREE|nr:hypothetical protein CspeluHIS016_0200860 [Cutaneotrichosporon spelunceum]
MHDGHRQPTTAFADSPTINIKPKAVLYCWPSSFLSNVPRLCLLEKGYPEDEYEIQHVDVTSGHNFSPSYLKINGNATIPTLVLPQWDPVNDIDNSRFHILDDLRSICAFIDVSRPSFPPSSATRRPAPTLSPLTEDDLALCEDLIGLVRSSQVDPNFLEVTARDASELRVKLRGVQGVRLRERHMVLTQHLNTARGSLSDAMARGGRKDSKQWAEMVTTLEDKWRTSQALVDIWSGAVDEERQLEYYEASRAAWTVHLPGTFAKLEVKMTGPYALGDDPSIADCYIIAWLARIVAMCGGSSVPTALALIEPYMGGVRLGNRLQTYWGHWIQRSSRSCSVPILNDSNA